MPSLLLLTATKAEAAPLINHFKLQKQGARKNIYSNEVMSLVVTGIGIKAANQTVKQLLIDEKAVLAIVNIGIAGAKTLEVGSLVWPSNVDGYAINSGVANEWLSAMQVQSFSKPTQATDAKVIYDMEAQGICNALVAKASHIKLFCAKVISDNERHSHTQISPQYATDLIRRHLVEFERMFDTLLPSTPDH